MYDIWLRNLLKKDRFPFSFPLGSQPYFGHYPFVYLTK